VEQNFDRRKKSATAFCRDVQKIDTNGKWRDINYARFSQTRWGEFEDLYIDEDNPIRYDYENFENIIDEYNEKIYEDEEFFVATKYTGFITYNI
jgi:hypothetical protein